MNKLTLYDFRKDVPIIAYDILFDRIVEIYEVKKSSMLMFDSTSVSFFVYHRVFRDRFVILGKL